MYSLIRLRIEKKILHNDKIFPSRKEIPSFDQYQVCRNNCFSQCSSREEAYMSILLRAKSLCWDISLGKSIRIVLSSGVFSVRKHREMNESLIRRINDDRISEFSCFTNKQKIVILFFFRPVGNKTYIFIHSLDHINGNGVLKEMQLG